MNIIGIFTIILGIFCIMMGLGVLGHDLHAQIICGVIGIVAILMGILINQLMKDDYQYPKSSTDKIQKESTK